MMQRVPVAGFLFESKRPIVTCLFLFFGATFFGGCESKNEFRPNHNTRGSIVGKQDLGECNSFSMVTPGISGVVGTHYDLFTGQLRSDFINLNVRNFPSDLWDSDKVSIVFYRWSGSTGTKQMNSVATRMFFIDKITGVMSTTTFDRLNQNTVGIALEQMGLENTVDSGNFLDRVMLVLTGMDLTYDAVTVAYYDQRIASTAISQIDLLLPAFYLDPALYQSANPSAVLYELHPFYSLLNSGAAMNDYSSMMSSYCQQVSGVGDRVPASAVEKPKAYPTDFSLLKRIWLRIVVGLSNFIPWVYP